MLNIGSELKIIPETLANYQNKKVSLQRLGRIEATLRSDLRTALGHDSKKPSDSRKPTSLGFILYNVKIQKLSFTA